MDYPDRIRLGYERFNARDWAAIARSLPEDFEAIDRAAVDERRLLGSDALRLITTSAGDVAFADLRMEAVEIEVLASGDDEVEVLVRVSATASGATSGAPVSSGIGHVWTFVEGAPQRFEQFRTWEDARRAAGLARRAPESE